MLIKYARSFVPVIGALIAAQVIAAGATNNVTVVAEVYQTKRSIAAPFLQTNPIDPDRFVAELRKRAQGFNSETKITKLPALTGMSGQRSVVSSADLYFEVQPLVSPNGESVNLNTVVTIGKEKRMTTSGTFKMGGTLFVGSFDGGTADSVQLVFVSASLHPQ